MQNEPAKNNQAQPADEELKVHGDKLARQVQQAAGKPAPEKESAQDKKTSKD